MNKKSCERWHEPHDNDSDAQHMELPEHYVAGVSGLVTKDAEVENLPSARKWRQPGCA